VEWSPVRAGREPPGWLCPVQLQAVWAGPCLAAISWITSCCWAIRHHPGWQLHAWDVRPCVTCKAAMHADHAPPPAARHSYSWLLAKEQRIKAGRATLGFSSANAASRGKPAPYKPLHGGGKPNPAHPPSCPAPTAPTGGGHPCARYPSCGTRFLVNAMRSEGSHRLMLSSPLQA
jgi:hypothetical protein